MEGECRRSHSFVSCSYSLSPLLPQEIPRQQIPLVCKNFSRKLACYSNTSAELHTPFLSLSLRRRHCHYDTRSQPPKLELFFCRWKSNCYIPQSPSMKFTCLSKGKGFHFPPCHILDICGFRVLLDCPMDLSALAIFSPIPTDSYTTNEGSSDTSFNLKSATQKIEKSLDAKNLICAEPWYKIDNNLLLWDVSFIDIVLISSPMGMLGLPFLSGMKGFSAKIYATEAAARLGKLMMEDLVSMHAELRQFYGPEESDFPQWLKWEELELLPSALREIAVGKDGKELGGWMPLYSAVDVKDCVKKIHTLRYGEEVCYNGTLNIMAISSGLEIGTCNWTINGPKRSIACLSSSVFVSAHAMNFDYHALQGSDSILFSDFSPLNISEDVEDNHNHSASTANDSEFRNDNDDLEDFMKCILMADESLEEVEKLYFISSCVIDCVKGGGSVLIPIGRLGIVLQLLEQISVGLESSAMKVPIYFISSVAEDLLAFTNIIPEWLCKERQEKLFSGEPLFAHVDLIKEKKLHLFPAIHSSKLLSIWQEPCIVFSSHWNLRLGPVVHLLRRWCGDPNSLLVMEEGVNADIALLPFKPMAMKVLQCSFLSGMKLQKIQPLLNILQPKLVLFPEELRRRIASSKRESLSFIHYSENETLRIPSLKDSSELEIVVEVSKMHWRSLKETNGVRLEGKLFMEDGKHRLLFGNEQFGSSQTRPLLHMGSHDPERLLTALQKMGIRGSIEQIISEAESGNDFIVNVSEPNKALIEVTQTSTVISTANEDLAFLISKAIDDILDGV